MSEIQQIVEQIAITQRASGESDAETARRIGVSRTAWHAYRTGSRSPSQRVLRHMAAAYPEVMPLVLSLFLPNNAPREALSSPRVPSEKRA